MEGKDDFSNLVLGYKRDSIFMVYLEVNILFILVPINYFNY